MTAPRRAGETQPARTALAWQRTGLGLLLVAGLLARGAAEQRRALLVAPAVVVAVAAIVVLGLLTPRRRRTSHRAASSAGRGHSPRTVASVTALVVLAAVCGLAADLIVWLT